MVQFTKISASLLFGLAVSLSWCGGWAQAQQPAPERPRRADPAPQPTPPTDDEEVVRVDTNLTNVLMTAIDKDKRFLNSLNKDDVSVFENDARQQIFTFQRQTDLPLTLVILIDVTRSQENTLDAEKAAARAFIDAVVRPQTDQAAVVSFADKVTIEQGQTNDLSGLHQAVDRVVVQFPPEYLAKDSKDPGCDKDPRGCSAIWDSVYDVLNRLIAPVPAGTRRAIILMTDGDDTVSVIKHAEASDLAVKDDTTIYAIGIGDRKNYHVDEKALRKLAEPSGGRAFFPQGGEDLSASFAQIQDELRSQYLVAYAPTNAVRDGSYRRIRVEVNNPELKKQKVRLLYRQGYYAKEH